MSSKKALIVLIVFGCFLECVGGSEEYRLVKIWPDLPRGWHFYTPCGVAVDKAGNVYVADTGNHRIKKFDSKGRFMMQWGVAGRGEGQLGRPTKIRIDDSGVIYVMDRRYRRIQKFTSHGKFIGGWGREEKEDDKFEFVDLAVDSSGNVFVLGDDFSPDREYGCPVGVKKFTPDGKLIAEWGSEGIGDGQFVLPVGIAVDTHGSVYVADRNNHRVQKFDSDGKFLTKWGAHGKGNGLFHYPTCIAFDASGYVYVADWHAVQKFTPYGKLLARWDTRGKGEAEFVRPSQIAVDASGNVYVADYAADKIVKFDSDGGFIEKWGSAGRGDSEFQLPGGIAVDAFGGIYVSDSHNHRIQKFASESHGNRDR